VSADLLVLGGGPAGVGAAYRAARAGRGVVLLERADRPGGAAGSFEVGGQRVDFGSHRLHRSIDPVILAELRTLLGSDLQLRPRRGRILLEGRWIGFPLRVTDLVRRLPPSFALQAARDAVLAPTRRPRADTFADVLRAGLGPTLCERFYFPYARKIWGLEPDELSGEQARRRVSAGSPARLLRRLLPGGSREKGRFWYPRRGYGQISERLAEAAAEAGADIRFEAAAGGVELDREGVRVHLEGGGSVAGERLWSTIPLAALARMAGAPPAVLEAASALELRSLLLVYLVLSTDRYTPYDAHYLPESFTPVTRVTEPKNYRDGDDPPGRTVLCAEIPCARGDAHWSADDSALEALVVRTLADAGLPRPDVEEVAVRRLAAAYPIYRLGFEAHFARLDGWADAEPRLLTFGRQGLFAHDNAHHALAMAWAAADALGPDGAFDEGAWAAARRRFADHVVED
jgi:protoporphyrinogen oxidase